ncbi:unnamed protein product [Staurois parvus]|uniref:Uncharacterized protein n=1 Tax=Staurois parvus TaxID=386267 RepID=A0ABN9C264_9NEOB|nr:unnamed protein product [Staurois parvus]
MNYLPEDSEERSVHELQNRLLNAQGQIVSGQPYASKASSNHPSPIAKPSKVSEVPAYKEGSIQALSKPPASTGFPPQPPVPSVFMPQPTHTTMGPPPSVPFQPASVPHSNAYPRAGPWPPYPAQQPQPGVPGFVQCQPFKQTVQIPTATSLTPSPVIGHIPPSIPMNVSGVPAPSGTNFFPPASHHSARGSTIHSASGSSMLMGQPPTPPNMTASHTPFNYPVGLGFHHGGPGAPANLPPPPTGSCSWLQTRNDATGEHEGWAESLKAGMQRKKPSAFVPPAPITAPVMSLSSEPDLLQPHLSSSHDLVRHPLVLLKKQAYRVCIGCL